MTLLQKYKGLVGFLKTNPDLMTTVRAIHNPCDCCLYCVHLREAKSGKKAKRIIRKCALSGHQVKETDICLKFRQG